MEDIQTANKYMKRSSKLLAIREMLIKTMMLSYYTYVTIVKTEE